MNIRDKIIQIIKEAVKEIIPFITEDEFKVIQEKYDNANKVGYELELEDTYEIDAFMFTVSDIAETHNMKYKIDQIYKQFENLSD